MFPMLLMEAPKLPKLLAKVPALGKRLLKVLRLGKFLVRLSKLGKPCVKLERLGKLLVNVLRLGTLATVKLFSADLVAPIAELNPPLLAHKEVNGVPNCELFNIKEPMSLLIVFVIAVVAESTMLVKEIVLPGNTNGPGFNKESPVSACNTPPREVD